MKKNIYIMYAISLLQGIIFYASIAMTYRLSRGLSLFEFGVIEGIFMFMMAVLEVPWGYVCDRIGYKKTLIICNFIYFISRIVFYKAYGFWMFFLERVLFAISASGISGCDTGYLYEMCKGEESTKVFSYYSAAGTFGLLFASFVFTFFIKGNIDLSGFLTIIPYGIAFVLTLFIDEIKRESDEHISMFGLIKTFIKDKKLILFLVVSVLLTESSHEINTFMSQLIYERAGISIEWYGVLYAILNIVGLSSVFLGIISKKYSIHRILYVLMVIGIISMSSLLMNYGVVVSVLSILALEVVEVNYYPLMNTRLNETVSLEDRASILSVYSLIMKMMSVVTNVLFGITSEISLNTVIMTCLVMMIMSLAGYILSNSLKTRK